MIWILLHEQLGLLHSIWRECLIASTVVVVGFAVGWLIGQERDHWLVHSISWYHGRILTIINVDRSLSLTCLLVFVHDAVFALALILLGRLGFIAWFVVAGNGFVFGVLSRLVDPSDSLVESFADSPSASWWEWLITELLLFFILLKIPATAITAGLVLAQGAISHSLDPHKIILGYAILVLPLLLFNSIGTTLIRKYFPQLSDLQ